MDKEDKKNLPGDGEKETAGSQGHFAEEKTAEGQETAGEKTAEGQEIAGEKTAEGQETAGEKTAEGQKTAETQTEEKTGEETGQEDGDWREDLAYLESEEYAGKKKQRVRPGESSEPQEEKKQPGRRRKKPGKRTLLLVLLLVLIGVGTGLYVRFAPTTKHMDPQAYFEWMLARERGEETTSLGEDEVAVILQDHVATQKALVRDDRLYLDYDMVRESIFTRFYWDEPNQVMLYTTQDDTWQIPLNSAEYTTKDGTASYEVPIFISDDRGKFICADFLKQYVNVDYQSYPEKKHAQVSYVWGTRLTAQVARTCAVRFGSGIKELILTSVKKGDTVYVLDQSEKWTRVLTPDGFIGWMPSGRLSEAQETPFTHDFTAPEYTSLTRSEKINLVWHQIGNEDANNYLASDTAGMTGVNVISPTWFSLTDNEGNFSSYASKSYVNKAHKKGLEVWGLVDNFSANMSTTTLMASTAARNTLVANLITAAKDAGLDGINIDFELIAEEAGYSYVQFMREMSVACRANSLVLSVDIPVPMAYNAHYDREELGVFCDYVIMMGYDEHYAGSDAGSVASLSFEETGIQNTLTAVPANKLISAIPFYTRLWYTKANDNGETQVWSEAYGMDTVATTLDTYNVDTVWNDETQQNYGEWTLEDGTLCQIWVEDEQSLALKAKLVSTYGLGGVAEWALGFERDSVWSIITDNIEG